MKRIVIVAAIVTGIAAAPAVLAADAGSGQGTDSPYAERPPASIRRSGTLYGPVHAGPPSSSSYGYVSR